MKICYVSACIIPSATASSVHVMKMCQALANNGHDVTLVATKGKTQEKIEPYDFYNVKSNFTLVLAPSCKIASKLSFISRLLVSINESRKSDLVYTRWSLAAFLLILFTDKKIIFEYHSTPFLTLYKLLESFVIKSHKVVRHIFITDSLRMYYLNTYRNLHIRDTVVLPDGADEFYGKANNCDSKVECVYIGSFYKGKGVDTIVEIAGKMPEMTFHIVGGSKAQITEMIKNIKTDNKNIIWHGYLSQKNAMEVLDKVKIALLPNQDRVLISQKNDIGKWTSPMKLFEYMSRGKAIIASNIQVLREVLIDEVNCLLVEPNDVEQWINAIRRLSNDNLLLEKISKTAKQDLETKYSWNIRAKKALKNLL